MYFFTDIFYNDMIWKGEELIGSKKVRHRTFILHTCQYSTVSEI